MQAVRCLAATPKVVEIEFGPSGLKSLRSGGQEFLERGEFLVNSATFMDRTGQTFNGAADHTVAVDQSDNRERLSYAWGTISIQYRVAADVLILNIDISNEAKAEIKSLSLDALALRLPQPPKEYNGVEPLLGTNVGAPTILPLTFGNESVVLCNQDVRRPLLIGFPWALDSPKRTIFPLRINTGRDPMYPASLPAINRPIAPGGNDRFSLSLRFAASSAQPQTVYGDLLNAFRKRYPFDLRWPDHRAIASLIIGTAAAHWPGNPRGWFLDPKLDVMSPAGMAAFQTRLIAWADRSIAILKKMDAQGMITWDIEGERFPHPVTYVGDPSLAEALAPEMEGVIDEYFKRFVRAGLRVGVTIRPQSFTIGQNGAPSQQMEIPDDTAADELIRKITYAKTRWGATLFYIYSNGDAVNPLSADVIAKVADAFPDVLLIPEHKNLAYYAKSAPYSELRGSFAATPSLVAEVYPRAFSVINTADGPIDKSYSELIEAVRRGDILMFRGWFDDPANTKVKAIYAKASGR